jgi:hypothetical protein
MKKIFKTFTAVIITALFCTNSFAMPFAPFEACKTAGTDLYVKPFKDTKKNKVNFLRTDTGCEIEIKSDNSGSMLVRKIGLESKKYKFINFDFKVTNLLSKANLKKKDGDDASARLYVFFDYEPDKAGFLEKSYRKYSGNKYDGKAIVYIWGSNVKKDEVFENPYSDQFIQIIVESGSENLGKYVSVKRNVYDDFKKHFKYEPPKNISSISIMTDTDNTGGKATGYFRRIFLSTD